MASAEEIVAVLDYYDEKPGFIRFLKALNKMRKLPKG